MGVELKKTRKTEALHAELERHWLSQLAEEHQQICWQYGVQLPLPSFELSDSPNRLGSWCPQRHQIRISRHLIITHPWFITLQILKHEMAHQLAGEEYSGGFDPAHGESFARACERLGVLPQFRAAKCPEPLEVERLWQGCPDTENRQVVRVKKLLALAESGNEHEAGLALDKARELIRRYQLEMLTAGDEVDLVCRVLDGKRKRLARYQHVICGLLSEFFMVRCVIGEQYDPARDDFFRVVELFGTRPNVRVAEYCWFFLENHLQLQWQKYKGGLTGHAGRYRNSFLLGMVRGFSKKLKVASQKEPTKESVTPEAKQLLSLESSRMNNYIACYHPRLQKRRRTVSRVYSNSFQEGMTAGGSLEFSRGIEQGQTDFGGFIE